MMSLLDDFKETCVFMEKEHVPDGEGGWLPSEWKEGAEFENYQSLDTSLQARVAEKEGVSSVYSVLVKKSVPIEYGDYFKVKKTGITYRVTSRPEEKEAPKSSSFDLKFFTAERTELPQ